MATQHLTFSWNKLLKIWGILIICPLRTLFTLKPATPSISISISISVSANQMVNLETWRHAGDHSEYYNGFPSRGGHYGGHKAREAVGCLFGAKYYVEFDGDFVVGLEMTEPWYRDWTHFILCDGNSSYWNTTRFVSRWLQNQWITMWRTRRFRDFVEVQ